MWFGRKFIALFLCVIFMLISGVFAPDKVNAITLGIVGLYTAFVGGHAATDVLNSKKTDVTVKTKVEEKTEDAD